MPNGGTLPQAPAASMLGPGSYAPPQMTQAAPGGTLPSITGGLDQNQLADLFKDLVPTTSMQDYQRAMTPVATRTPLSMAGFQQRPIERPGPVQLDRSEVVGAGNARGQGISNAVSASVGALAQFKAIHDEHKQAADANKVATYIDATNKLQQAQQMMQQLPPNDPQRAEMQKVIDSNNNLIQGMSSDPKFVKTLEKGFNVSLTDPSQNKTPDHNIVQRGLALFQRQRQQPLSPQAAQGVAQRFQQSQPMGLGPNVQAQQELQMKQAIDAGKAEMAKQRMEYIKSQTPISVAQILAFGEIQKTQMEDNAKWNLATQKFGFDANLAAFDRNTRLMVANITADSKNQFKNIELFQKMQDDYSKSMESLNQKATELTAKIQAAQTSSASSSEKAALVAEYRGQQAANQQMLDATRDRYNSTKKLFSQMTGVPLSDIQEQAPPQVGAGIPDAGPEAQSPVSESLEQQLINTYFQSGMITPGINPEMGKLFGSDSDTSSSGPGPKFGDIQESRQ